jgi:hypothetical protein
MNHDSVILASDLIRYIDKTIADHSYYLENGQCPDFYTYKYLVGQIHALRDLKNNLQDLVSD